MACLGAWTPARLQKHEVLHRRTQCICAPGIAIRATPVMRCAPSSSTTATIVKSPSPALEQAQEEFWQGSSSRQQVRQRERDVAKSAQLVDKRAAPIRQLTPDTWNDYITNQDLVLVDFYTDWCGPCQLMHKEFDKLTQAFPQGIAFAKVNCSHHEEFSTQQRIRSLPTFKLYKGGQCVEQVSGAKPSQLRQLLAYYYRPG